MKKLIAIACMSVALSAHAANWVVVSDSADSTLRLLVDTESFAPANADDGTPLIGAMFSFVKEGDVQPPIAYVTAVQSCINRGGPILARAWDKDHFNTVAKHWWTANGPKMYDEAGAALCTMLNMASKTPAVNKDKPVKGNT